MKLKCNFDFKFKNPPRVLSCIFGFEVCFFKLEFKPGVGGGFLRAFTSQKGPGKGLPASGFAPERRVTVTVLGGSRLSLALLDTDNSAAADQTQSEQRWADLFKKAKAEKPVKQGEIPSYFTYELVHAFACLGLLKRKNRSIFLYSD